MKTFITITTVAVLAIAFVISNASQVIAGCDGRPPPKNTTEPRKCDALGPLLTDPLAVFCMDPCERCYGSLNLQRRQGCYVKGKCHCLGRVESTTTPGTPTTELTTTTEVTTANKVSATTDVPTTVGAETTP